MKKILIIRFSSIGDIVLTTPVIRCIKQQLPGVSVHFLTKEVFAGLIHSNPYVDKCYTVKDNIAEVIKALKAEAYDAVIDLHHNFRSLRIKQALGVKSYSFHKLNVPKFLAVYFKRIHGLPPVHIVNRYLDAAKPLGIVDDGRGLDFFIPENERVNVVATLFNNNQRPYVVLVVGGSYYTKQIPLNKLNEICALLKLPVVLLGSKQDDLIAQELQKKFPQVINACGRFTIHQSASVIQQAQWVISSDTGLMHIASAFNKKIISVWGNTIPEFGMGPYLPSPENKILEVKGLSCRPCSKLGFKKCPKGHFKCMNEQDFSFLTNLS